MRASASAKPRALSRSTTSSGRISRNPYGPEPPPRAPSASYLSVSAGLLSGSSGVGWNWRRALFGAPSEPELGENGQGLHDSDPLLALRGGNRLGDLDDRLRGLGLRIALDQRLAEVAGLAQARIERHGSEQRHAQLLRQARAPAGPEGLAAHVLDDAEQAHVRLLRHQRGACGDLLRERLRRRHDHRLGAG